MWRRVLLALVFVGKGTIAAEGKGVNEDVFKKLCNITKGVMGLMGKDGEHKGSLQKALYGEKKEDPFEGDGTFTGGCIELGMHSRSQYCSHIQPGRGSTRNGHGCFGDSLVGTFLCLCTKGGNGEKDLCGLNNVGDGAGWISNNGNEQTLFQKVWEEVKTKCFKNNEGTVNQEELNVTVEKIKEEALKKKINGGNKGYYLGGDKTTGQCSGVNPGEACVTYPAKSDKVNEPDIPWADKILTALQTLKTQQQTTLQNSATTSEKHQDHEDPSVEVSEEEGEEEEDEASAQKHDPQSTSKPSRQKRKRRSTNNQPAEQHEEPRKVILHKDDGSLLPQPFWLLSAVFVF
ncbi:Variant surface glycoprotein [Trypanosoma congolense IL3000]|uniref:Variant surface glycoprotein n=1 Tax=Trypanosoma congolense (strain IL3000) TaxID=1068625 RepID=F9WGE5_TRYCI|nr:Variant surface glycoprotein [Trypanosoma congolense IL3000]